eukprot:scaffold200297_cov15-Tisochrysis_lutea.AAC.1
MALPVLKCVKGKAGEVVVRHGNFLTDTHIHNTHRQGVLTKSTSPAASSNGDVRGWLWGVEQERGSNEEGGKEAITNMEESRDDDGDDVDDNDDGHGDGDDGKKEEVDGCVGNDEDDVDDVVVGTHESMKNVEHLVCLPCTLPMMRVQHQSKEGQRGSNEGKEGSHAEPRVHALPPAYSEVTAKGCRSKGPCKLTHPVAPTTAVLFS